MTKSIYKEITNGLGEVMIERTDADGKVWWIPTDPANSDYQRYLNPEAEQSTPIVINEAETI
jgi:hypothetical protein